MIINLGNLRYRLHRTDFISKYSEVTLLEYISKCGPSYRLPAFSPDPPAKNYIIDVISTTMVLHFNSSHPATIPIAQQLNPKAMILVSYPLDNIDTIFPKIEKLGNCGTVIHTCSEKFL